MSALKCQCPNEGKLKPSIASMYDSETELPFVIHAPGECKCTNDIRRYRRGETILNLCSCCFISGDKEVV